MLFRSRLLDDRAWLAAERAQLLPYTDQKQPLAIEQKGQGWAPSVVVQVERIDAPRGTSTRPTSDRVREALFSTIDSRIGALSGLRFLDLYAGSGAFGLEALSRGRAPADGALEAMAERIGERPLA